MVNFVSIFCPELQKLLKPIYYLTRKGRQFAWGVEQQNVFEEIKLLCKAVWSNQLIFICLGGIILHMIVCTVIHN